MLAAIAEKASQPALEGRLTCEALSFERLDKAEGRPYDLVFSNLGGLNCAEDLTALMHRLPDVLRPGGSAVLVVMPPFCPWEVGASSTGPLFDRPPAVVEAWHAGQCRGRTRAGVVSRPGQARESAGGRVSASEGPEILLIVRAAVVFRWLRAASHPRLLRWLMRLDDALAGVPPLNRCGDFYMLIARYEP